jgi:hypothetical protein
MQSYTSHILSFIMVFQRPSYLTEDLFLLYVSRNNYMVALTPTLSEAQHIIVRLIVRPSESIKSLKIYFAYVS